MSEYSFFLLCCGLWYLYGVCYMAYHLWQDRKRPKSMLDYMIEVMPWYQKYPLYLAAFLIGPMLWFQIEQDRTTDRFWENQKKDAA